MRRVQPGPLTAVVWTVVLGCGSSELPGHRNEPNEALAPDAAEPGANDIPVPTGKPGEAIFVSSSRGSEKGSGSSLRPVRTLSAGMALAAEKNLPVIACAETYAESLRLVDGVGIFGYFDCTDLETWRRTDARATIVAPTSPAVLVEDVQSTRIEGFDVIAPDMTGLAVDMPAASSYAMVVRRSKRLTMTEVSLQAGKGQDGSDGAEPIEGNAELSTKSEGVNAGGQSDCLPGMCELLRSPPLETIVFKTRSGAAGGISVCRVGPPGGPGGKGGDGPIANKGEGYRFFMTTEGNGQTATADGKTATGGVVDDSQPSGDRPGSVGAKGAQGSIGAHGIWSFGEHGEFTPGDGVAGGNGAPGQGGGGGAGSKRLWDNVSFTTPPHKRPRTTFGTTEAGATGAGGGAGGCGGIAGSAGRGGGASLGLVVVGSESIWLYNVRIASGKGGRGGKGTQGTNGTPGSRGGGKVLESHLYSGSAGGHGGAGGAAGLSGHGAPGPSIALAYHGPRPKTDKVELVVGERGDGGLSLTSGEQTLPAIVGVSDAEREF